MRFVNGEAIHLQGGQQGKGSRSQQGLRGQVEEFHAVFPELRYVRPVLFNAQGAVQEKGRNAVFPQLVHLVLHEGDQRGNHDRQSVKDHSWNLITKGLAPSRRHHDQGVLFLQDMGNNLFLEGPERFKAEDFFQDGLRTIHGDTH